MHPLNKNQLYYPGFNGAGNGGSNGASILASDFGDWTDLPQKSTEIYDEQIDIQFKLDLLNYPTKAILYLAGQFGLNSAFVGSQITLGVLPINTRPKHQIKMDFTAQGSEIYLIIETTGEVKLQAPSGDLPVCQGQFESDPYFLNLDYNPQIDDTAELEPLNFTATRTANFTRNNCGNGFTGSVVSFAKNYTSQVSQADADNQATIDANFNADGQAFANDPANGGTCTAIITYNSSRTANFTRNNCGNGYNGTVVSFTKNYSSQVSQADANNQAANDANFNAAGQAYANGAGNCILVSQEFWSATRSQDFRRNNCGNGYTGSVILFTKNYQSYVSQADADNIAANDPNFNGEGQAYANDPNNGATCTVEVVRSYTLGQHLRKLRLESNLGTIVCEISITVNYYVTTRDNSGNNPVVSGPFTQTLNLPANGTRVESPASITTGLYDTIEIIDFQFTPKYCGNIKVMVNNQPGEEATGIPI